MDFNLQPWQLYLVILTGWINRHQQEVTEYLLTENQVLKEKLGKKRILLTDDQRRRLAVKRAVGAYLNYYHAERNHQGLRNQILEPGKEVGRADGKIECRESLGGILRYYHRQAA